MGRNRLEAFSDGVIAIIITIMVLELKIPHGTDWPALLAVSPIFLGYALSFLFVAIYWINHHHLLHTVEKVSPGILWANTHLLFWLSLFPFATGWIAETGLSSATAGLYGFLQIMAAVAYTILTMAIKAAHGPGSKIAEAIGSDIKGKVSLASFVVGFGLSFFVPAFAMALYAAVAMWWLVPDQRIARLFGQ